MVPEISLTAVLPVAAIAFLMPLVLGLVPSVRLPSVVLEIVAGIVIGPAVLGFVEVDLPLQVLALLGLAFLLLLAGLEIDLDRLRGARPRSAAAGFVISLAVGGGGKEPDYSGRQDSAVGGREGRGHAQLRAQQRDVQRP
jgi:Kef-type K+ transport system membrane component KefB